MVHARSRANTGPAGRPTYRARRWQELLDEVHALIKTLEDGAELLDRASIASRWDGFPTATSGGGGGGGIDPNPFASKVADRVDYELGLDVDENGRPVRRRDPDEDLVADAARDMRAQVLTAIRALRSARKAQDRGRPKHPPHRPAAVEAPGCVNCERFDVYTIAYKDGRCVACYGYRRRSRDKGEGAGLGLDAPERLVRARPENATRRDLAERVDPTDPSP